MIIENELVGDELRTDLVALEQKMVFIGRNTQSVEQTFQAVADQNQREIQLVDFGLVEQSGPDRCRLVDHAVSPSR